MKWRHPRVGTIPVLILAGLLAFAPLVVMTVTSIDIGTRSIRGQVDRRLSTSAALSASFVAARTGTIVHIIAASANGPLLRAALIDPAQSPADLAAIRGRLAQLQSGAAGSLAAFITDAGGRLTDVQPFDPVIVGQLFSGRDWYRGVIAARGPYVSDAYRSAYTGHPLVVAMAVPVFADGVSGDILAVVAVIFPVLAVQGYAARSGVDSDLSVTLVDHHGTILAGPTAAPDRLVSMAKDGRVVAVLAGRSGLAEASVGGRPVLSAYAPVPELGWGLITQIDKGEAMATATTLQTNITALMALLSLLILAGLATFGFNLNQRRRAEAALADLNARLEERVMSRTDELTASNQELEAFTYSVSHDLRAPLRAMAGFATKLDQRLASDRDPEASRYAQRILVNAQRMGQLIDELLMLSRLSRQELRKKTILPGDAARGALVDLQDDVDASRADVTIVEMAPCNADPGLLQQVYANLISNALKYSRGREHPVVEIGSETTAEKGTVYYVRDNGAGFDMRFKDKLFGVFQRLHGTDEYEGIGVGLAIVKRIVTRHGGAVFADGAVDAGATFSFTLGGSENAA